MATKNKPTRVDKEFLEDLNEVARIRLSNGLCKMSPKEISPRKMTQLLTRTDGYRKSLEELKYKPERKKK